jgi:hypothetical protein
VLAKEVLHSRKAISRLYVNKAQMMSIGNALTEQLGKLSALYQVNSIVGVDEAM